MKIEALFAPEELDFSGSVWRTDDGGFVTSSLKVAEYFGKQHKDVLDAIREKLVAENSATKSWFFESTYDNRGKRYPMYLMNQSGFTFIAMGFTGAKADEIKIGYINEFERMRATIRTNQIAVDFHNPEYVKMALLALSETQEENKQLKIELAEAKPLSEIGQVFCETNGGMTIGQVAKECGIKGLTRDYLLAVLVAEGVARRVSRGYEKLYSKHSKEFVDARLYQKEKYTPAGNKLYLKVTVLGYGWLVDLAKRRLAEGFKPEGRKRRVK